MPPNSNWERIESAQIEQLRKAAELLHSNWERIESHSPPDGCSDFSTTATGKELKVFVGGPNFQFYALDSNWERIESQVPTITCSLSVNADSNWERIESTALLARKLLQHLQLQQLGKN